MIKFLKLIKQIIKLIILILRLRFINKKGNVEKKIKQLIEECGPVFIKFAQIISIRNDILSKNITKELEKLQTNTYQIHFSIIEKKIKNIDKHLYEKIKKINENPIASASIAQIHTAVLKNNKKIIIKFLKPDVKEAIKRDINILYKLAKISTFILKKFERLKLIDLVDELKKTLESEINFENENFNMIKIKEQVKNFKNIYIPNIILNSKKDDILIMEYLDGINITNTNKLIKKNIKQTKIISMLLHLFYRQVFEQDIFHADLHPGNILISQTVKKNIIIVLLDFGIMGNLTYDEKIYLSENILAFAKKDYAKIIHLHIKAKTIHMHENINKMEKELNSTFKPIFDKTLKNIDFKKTITSLMALSKSFNMQLQPNLILFQKTLLSIEGLCRNLDTQINLWQITRNVMAKIFIKNLFKIKKLNIVTHNKKENKKNANALNYRILFSNNIFFLLISGISSLIILNLIIKYYKIIIFFI
ncbi:MAG TPA: ABC1 kinase family protein [Candidatus Azoamicus sp.]